MDGNRLRLIRELKGFTQAELSQRLNLGEKEIWRYENGKSKPSADTLAQIASELQVSADYLLGLTDDLMPNLKQSDLLQREREVVAAMRTGQQLEAIKAIVGG